MAQKKGKQYPRKYLMAVEKSFRSELVRVPIRLKLEKKNNMNASVWNTPDCLMTSTMSTRLWNHDSCQRD